MSKDKFRGRKRRMEWLAQAASDSGCSVNIKWRPKLNRDMWKLIRQGLVTFDRAGFCGSARRTKKRSNRSVTLLVATEKGKEILNGS